MQFKAEEGAHESLESFSGPQFVFLLLIRTCLKKITSCFLLSLWNLKLQSFNECHIIKMCFM